MPPAIQQFMNKLNANERMLMWGAVIVFIASLLGGGWIPLVGSAAVLVILWLKYAPNQNINWPMQVEVINLGISAIIGLLALVGVLGIVGFGGFGLYGGLLGGMYILWLLGGIAVAVGAVMMLLGSWREYQAMPKTTPPSSTPPSSSPPAPPAA